MIKVLEMRIAINQLLKTLHPRVFFHTADKDADFPHVVFDLPNSNDIGTLENFVLDIDVWDTNEDTTELETLIDTIDINLHKKTIFIEGKMGIIFYRENRLTLSDDDPRIHRRKYIYQAKTYQKNY